MTLNVNFYSATLTRFELNFDLIDAKGERYFGDIDINLRKRTIEVMHRHIEDLVYSFDNFDMPERFFTELENVPLEKVPSIVESVALNFVRQVYFYKFEEES